jgi:putative tricarboxylic transport membrane protein
MSDIVLVLAEIFQQLAQGAANAITPINIVGILLGYSIGVVAGSIPGIMGVTAMVLILPFTFTMEATFAIAAMMGCYKGAAYAGSITATLFNIPGTPEAAATGLDSYPMSQRGEQQRALELALWASVIGGTISNFLLIFTAPPLAKVALKLGPAETAALILFSLTAVIGLLGDTRMDIWKGFLSVIMGLMIATIGLDPMNSTRRYVFGFEDLDGGIAFVLAVIAFLAFSEILEQAEDPKKLRIRQSEKKVQTLPYSMRQRWVDLKFCFKDLVRSSILGSILGAMPGIGAPPTAFVCYGEAKRGAKDNSRFGKGDPRGIVAPEAGNNAVAASSLIPLITLGIPGSVAAAVLFGAFMIQGMIPGPMLMQDQPEVIYGLFALFIVTDILGGFVIALPFIYLVRKLFSSFNYALLFPCVIVCCAVGVYAEEFDLFAVRMLLILGAGGYFLQKAGFNLPSLVLAFILGPILERETRTALLISDGTPMIFITSPIAASLLGLSVLALGWSLWKKMKATKRQPGTQGTV